MGDCHRVISWLPVLLILTAVLQEAEGVISAKSSRSSLQAAGYDDVPLRTVDVEVARVSLVSRSALAQLASRAPPGPAFEKAVENAPKHVERAKKAVKFKSPKTAKHVEVGKLRPYIPFTRKRPVFDVECLEKMHLDPRHECPTVKLAGKATTTEAPEKVRAAPDPANVTTETEEPVQVSTTTSGPTLPPFRPAVDYGFVPSRGTTAAPTALPVVTTLTPVTTEEPAAVAEIAEATTAAPHTEESTSQVEIVWVTTGRRTKATTTTTAAPETLPRTTAAAPTSTAPPVAAAASTTTSAGTLAWTTSTGARAATGEERERPPTPKPKAKPKPKSWEMPEVIDVVDTGADLMHDVREGVTAPAVQAGNALNGDDEDEPKESRRRRTFQPLANKEDAEEEDEEDTTLGPAQEIRDPEEKQDEDEGVPMLDPVGAPAPAPAVAQGNFHPIPTREREEEPEEPPMTQGQHAEPVAVAPAQQEKEAKEAQPEVQQGPGQGQDQGQGGEEEPEVVYDTKTTRPPPVIMEDDDPPEVHEPETIPRQEGRGLSDDKYVRQTGESQKDEDFVKHGTGELEKIHRQAKRQEMEARNFRQWLEEIMR